MQNFPDLYERGRYQELVNKVDLANFSAVSEPLLTKIIAASYFHLGRFSEAMNLLKEIESCFSHDPNYLSLFGACLRRCGDLDAAQLQFEKALEINPEQAAIRNNYANLLIDLGNFQKAKVLLDQLLAEDSDYSDARVNLSRLNERERIQQLQSDDVPSAQSSTWVLADPLMLAFAEDEVKRTRPKSSDAQTLQSNLSKNLKPLKSQQIASDQLITAFKAVNEGRYSFALQLCSQIHQSMPASTSLFECMSDAYIGLQRFAEAEICILHSLQLGDKSFKLYLNLVSLLCIRGDFSLAQHYLELASTIDETSPLLEKYRLQIAKAQRNINSSFLRFDQEWKRPQMSKKSH